MLRNMFYLIILLIALLIGTKSYQPLTYEEIVERFQQLSETYPSFIKLTTAQNDYGLPEVSCHNKKCKTYIAKITNYNHGNLTTKPQLFISGAVHGDERLGPVVSTEYATFLLKNFDTDLWVQRLLNRTLLIITPTTNAQGYAEDHRTENVQNQQIDPNRDFPYQIFDSTKCMQTVAARAVNELFQHHLFILSITFHGGTVSMTYPWGAPNHIKYIGRREVSTEAPDNQAAKQTAEALQRYSNSSIFGQYTIGPHTDIVYDVDGGMED